MDFKKLREHLEATPIEQTKTDLSLGLCGPIDGENHKFVSAWLAEQEANALALAASRAEAREIRSLQIAAESLAIAKRAHILAFIAIIISVLAIVAGSGIF